jgi:WD40 repeat protein
VIHRDIKPANIIRQAVDKRLFLVDLGAAKYATGTALMMTGTVIGSAEYTAPEQARGKAVFASDIYGLGATCLHLLTGLSPFDLYDSSEGRWIWRDYLQHPVSAALGRMLEKMLEGPTNRRYQTVDEILTDLNQECSSSSSADKHWQPSPKTSASNSQQQLKLTNSESIPNWQPRTASFSVAASGKLATTNQLQNQQQGDLPDKRRKLAKRSMLDFLLLTFIFYILTVMIIGLLSPYPSSFWRGLFEQFQAQWNKPKPPFSIYDQPPKFTPPVERLQTLALPRSVLSLAIKPDGKTIAIGGSDWEYLKLGNLQVWDLKTGKFLNSLSGPSAVTSLAISPDGKTLACFSSGVQVWNLQSGELLRTLSSRQPSSLVNHGRESPLTFSPDGKFLASILYDNKYDSQPVIWNTATEFKDAFALPTKAVDIRFTPDPQTVAIATFDTSDTSGLNRHQVRVEIWNWRSRQPVRRLQHAPEVDAYFRWDSFGAPVRVTMAQNRHLLVLALVDDVSFDEGFNSAIQVWNLQDRTTSTPIHTQFIPDEFVQSIDISPDGTLIATVGNSPAGWFGEQYAAKINLLNARTGQLLRTLSYPSHQATSVVFSPDGKQLIVGDRDGTIKVWRVDQLLR